MRVTEPRQPLGRPVENTRRPRRRRRVSHGVQVLCSAGRELEVGHALRPETTPDRPIGRRRLGFVDAPSNEVEERRRELVRPRLAALAKQRRHERRFGVGRRLLLVLPVVPRSSLPAQEPEHGRDDEQSRERGEHENRQSRAERVILERLNAIAVTPVALGIGALLFDDPIESVPSNDLHTERRSERRAGDQRSQLDELMSRDADGAERRTTADEVDVAAHPHGLAPSLEDPCRRALDRDETRERLGPLVSPDLEVDVDDIVVRDRDPAQRVRDRERTRLVARVEVPDDAYVVAAPHDAERPGVPGSEFCAGTLRRTRRRARRRTGARGVSPAPKRDVAVAEVEVA